MSSNDDLTDAEEISFLQTAMQGNTNTRDSFDKVFKIYKCTESASDSEPHEMSLLKNVNNPELTDLKLTPENGTKVGESVWRSIWRTH